MSAEGDRWLATLPERARERLPAPVHEYVLSGAREGVSAAAAAGAWRSVGFWPRVLRDVSGVDPSVELLGDRLPMPFGVAPTTLQRALHPDGEVAMARAVTATDGLLVVSSNAGRRFEDIGATGVRWWLQCYLPVERELAVPLLRRAVDTGAGAVVLTVDTPVVGTKYAAGDSVWDVVDPSLLRVNLPADHATEPGWAKALDLGPADLGWLAEATGLPVVVKGVLRAADAALAVTSGASAVWVSNHGGRQLDRAVSTAEALPGVVHAVAGRAPVLVDGGIRSGLDVVAALGLGADLVLLGRLPLLALTEGEEGVTRLLAELGEQTVEAMRLAGAPGVAAIRDVVAGPTRNR